MWAPFLDDYTINIKEEKENMNYDLKCSIETPQSPKRELSDRLKDIIFDIHKVCESINISIYNTLGNMHELPTLKEPESHFQSIETIELLLSYAKEISAKLEQELR